MTQACCWPSPCTARTMQKCKSESAKAATHHLGPSFFDFCTKEMGYLGKQASSTGLVALDDKTALLTHEGGPLVQGLGRD